MGKFEVYLVRILLEFVMLFFIFFFWLTWFKVIKIRQEPKMKPIAIFTLVIWCIGVESLPGVRERRETKGCSSLVFPSPKRYQVFYEGNWDGPKWQEAREACQASGGDLAQFSNRQEEDQILNVIREFPTGNWQNYYIGIEKKHKEAFWISEKKLELDSDLKFSKHSLLGKESYWGLCGSINFAGITDSNCGAGSTSGYVCEFASNESIDTAVEFCNNDNEDNNNRVVRQVPNGDETPIKKIKKNNNNEDNNDNEDNNNDNNNNNNNNNNIPNFKTQ